MLQYDKYVFVWALMFGAMLALPGCGSEAGSLEQLVSQQEIAAEKVVSEESKLAASVDVEMPESESRDIVVYVCGAVCEGGVIRLEQGARLYEALEEAGGFAPGADREQMNLAEILSDGMRIYFPYEGETGTVQSGDGNPEAGGKALNINTASAEQLQTLPGIGETRALAIIAYRTQNGDFAETTDLMLVSGIGEASFEKLADLITVKD